MVRAYNDLGINVTCWYQKNLNFNKSGERNDINQRSSGNQLRANETGQANWKIGSRNWESRKAKGKICHKTKTKAKPVTKKAPISGKITDTDKVIRHHLYFLRNYPGWWESELSVLRDGDKQGSSLRQILKIIVKLTNVSCAISSASVSILSAKCTYSPMTTPQYWLS